MNEDPATWWPLLSPLGDYAEAAASYSAWMRQVCGRPTRGGSSAEAACGLTEAACDHEAVLRCERPTAPTGCGVGFEDGG